MKTLFKLSVIFLLLGSVAQAQVGVNTLSPDTTAILHIYSDNKGVLLPTLDTNGRDGLRLAPAADGLLVYDSVDKVYYFFNRTTKKWIAMNPFQTTEDDDDNGASDDVKLAPRFQNRNVVIGGDSADRGIKLHVKGNIKADSTVYAENALISDSIRSLNFRTTNAHIDTITSAVKTNAVHTNTIQIKRADIDTITSAIRANAIYANTIRADTIYGSIPVGGIIMWSGAIENIHPHWALCDGTNGTPNLKGRFIVGYDPNDYDYNYTTSIIRTGGAKQVTLSETHIPAHTHRFTHQSNSTTGMGGSSTRGVETSFNASSSNNITTSSTGGGQPHENRPPYYVLAYIMRIK
jgi:hypothetical protein